ncbi:hypothetical protein ACWDSD_10415 [Streptomyces spiralis]
MADHGGDNEETGRVRRSRLADYAEMTRPGGDDEHSSTGVGTAPLALPEETPPPSPADLRSSSESADDESTDGRREFAALLGEFRRTAVLVPLGEDEAPLVGEYGGVRWIYAFSDEAALSRFAVAKGDGSREWTYRRVLGARLLDAAVPAAGMPCGVALDVGSGGDAVLFPPVAGIVPDGAAVDIEEGERPQ